MKSCMLEQLSEEEIFWEPGGRNCTTTDRASSSDAWEFCMKESKKNCADRAKRALAAQGGDVTNFAVEQVRAANVELESKMSSCGSDTLDNETTLAALLVGNTCK